MDSAVFLLLAALTCGSSVHVSGTEVTALYGETIVVPCNGGAPPPEDLMFVKWKYEKDDGTIGELLIKHPQNEKFTVGATDGYAQRVSIDDAYSLRITAATLRDQKMFTCMVVSEVNLMEYPVTVVVRKKPSSVEIVDAAEVLQKDKLMMVGTCVAADASPAATITWKKNGETLTADGKAVTITPSMKVDPSTGLSSTSSTLQFSASKLDSGAVFTCEAAHVLANQEAAMKPVTVHYPSESVRLVTSNTPIAEGDNVTLKCVADGNPPPSSFVFFAKGQKTAVDSDSLLLSSVSREAAGEYRCSLPDDEKLQASQNIVVNYLDFSLEPMGKVVKTVGESLAVKVEQAASGDVTVTWTKDGEPMEEPTLSALTYADAGVYVCEASTDGLRRQHRFELVVEGKPAITSLTKERAADGKYKVLVCEAEGVPEPRFTWSINNTNEDSSYSDGKAVHKIRVIPRVNLTVTCSVSNRLGEDVKTINVSSVFNEADERKGSPDDSEDQSKLIVGVVVGLLIAAGIVGLIYWLYMKNSRQGSWKTGEKETGTPEENKKLEENNQPV